MDKNETRLSRSLRIIAFLFFVAALSLIILLRIFEKPKFMEWYGRYANMLVSYQNWVQQYGQTFWTIAILLAGFVLKALIPWLPITVMLFVSGAIFDWYIAIPINFVGSVMLFTIKFFWGRRWGGGNTELILRRYDNAHIFVDKGKVGSKMVLFFSRMTPLVPINSVSQLYGTTTMPYWQYILISILGFSYKLFSYTMIGRNIFNPLSSSFFMPVIGLFIISGLVLLLINAVITATTPLFQKLAAKKGNKQNEQS